MEDGYQSCAERNGNWYIEVTLGINKLKKKLCLKGLKSVNTSSEKSNENLFISWFAASLPGQGCPVNTNICIYL